MTEKVTQANVVDKIVAWESGKATFEEALELFAFFVKTGMAWRLEGHIGRTATNLIESGFISQDGKILETDPSLLV